MSFSSENETVVNSDLPVVLVHAACTGGSLIYRLMVSNFGLFGLTEIGHGRRTAFGFSPVDPEAQMFSLGQIDHDEFGKILSERLINADKIARHREQRLLVREHSHNYFFNPDNAEVVPAGPSWVADHLEPYFQSELPIVVTVRDPIDSWLGFRQNFNHLQPKRFEDYCERYNQFFDRIEARREKGKAIHVFKYEDCVVGADETMAELAGFLNLSYSNLKVPSSTKGVSTGNSGRQGNSLSLRKRRPFSMKLVNEVKNNAQYARLCKRLGYKPLHEDLSAADRFSATFYSMLSPIRKLVGMAEAPGKWLYKVMMSGRGIQ